MGQFKIINEKPIGMAQLKDKLKEIEKRKKELSFRANKTKEYANSFDVEKTKEAEALAKKIEGLKIPRLKERHIVKIIDIMPKDLDSLKAILSGETITVKEEDLKKILNVVK